MSSSARPHHNRVVRIAFFVAGSVLLVIGVAGIFLPLLPSVVFLVAAAACYARASERVYERLLASRLCGPLIREWREHRSVSRRTKWTALVVIVLTFLTTTVFFVPGRLPRLLVLLVGAGVFTIVSRLRVRDPSVPAAPASRAAEARSR